jgi:hypothetical protein
VCTPHDYACNFLGHNFVSIFSLRHCPLNNLGHLCNRWWLTIDIGLWIIWRIQYNYFLCTKGFHNHGANLVACQKYKSFGNLGWKLYKEEEAATNQRGLIKYTCSCTWCCGGGMPILRYVHNKMTFQIICTSLHSHTPYSGRVNSLPNKNHVFEIVYKYMGSIFNFTMCTIFQFFSLKMYLSHLCSCHCVVIVFEACQWSVSTHK